MMRRLLVLVVVCCACKDSVIPVGTIRGTYTLRTVDGNPLPYTLSQTTGSATVIVADSITLMESSIYHEGGTRSVTTNGVTTTSPTADYGDYALLSTSLTLHSNADNSTRTGTLDGNTMTVLVPPHVEVYKKLN
jgi:hypothetical protein